MKKVDFLRTAAYLLATILLRRGIDQGIFGREYCFPVEGGDPLIDNKQGTSVTAC